MDIFSKCTIGVYQYTAVVEGFRDLWRRQNIRKSKCSTDGWKLENVFCYAGVFKLQVGACLFKQCFFFLPPPEILSTQFM